MKEQVLSLYKTAFNDPDDFTEDFIDRYFETSCRYTVKDGRVVSMLFLLDATMQKGEEMLCGKYLYAAATHPDFKGQGLMTDLIEKAKRETAEKGEFLLTKPATETLFNFYKKFGFKTAVFSKDEQYRLTKKTKPLKKLNKNDYLSKRAELLKEQAYITLSDTDYIYSFFTLFGNENTVCAVDLTDEIPTVREFISLAEDGKDALLLAVGKNKAVFREQGDTPFAMIILPKGKEESLVNFSVAID